MKKLFLVLASLTLLPTLTSYGITDNQKYILGGLGIVVVGGTVVYYINRSSSAQTPQLQQLVSDESDKSTNNQNQLPQEGFVRHQKVYGQSEEQREAQRRFQELVAGEAEALKKQEEQLKKEPAPQQNNTPTQPILSPATPNAKPNLNNPLPSHKQSNAPQNTISATKEDNFSYSCYCQRVSEIGWDY